MEYPALYKVFSNHIKLPEEDYLDLESRLIRKTINKKEYLFREGQIVNYLPFISEGLMVNYRLDESGNRHVIQIGRKGSWLGDLFSFFSRTSTSFNIQAYQTTELLLINHETYTYITKKHPSFEKFFRLNIQYAYTATLNEIFKLHSLSAEERYLQLIKHIPTILEDMPHYLIASYLNIESQSLSRIRKKLKK